MIIILLIHTTLFGQGKSLEDVRNEQKKIKHEIEYTNKRLKEAGRKRKVTLGQVMMINKKINERERLINNYNSEIDIIDQDIVRNHKTIDTLKRRISLLKGYYDIAIRNYYRLVIQKDGVIGLVFSSHSFNQAYNRIRYIREFISYQEKLFDQLQSDIEVLNHKNNELNTIIEDRKLLISEIDNERKKYQQEKRNNERKIRELRSQETRLKQEIAEKNRIAERLSNEVNRIIAEERRKSVHKSSLTPEEKLISDQFSENKGRLPWPTETGVVIDGYGAKAHPVLKHVTINNEGIDLMTKKGEKARAVFKGKVSRVVAIPGANEVVIVKHGDFFTVYQNLTNVRVRSGQEINTKDVIGDVYTDEDKNETILHFEIWKGRDVQNPEKWIVKGKSP